MKRKILFIALVAACSTAIFLSCKKNNEIVAAVSPKTESLVKTPATRTSARNTDVQSLRMVIKPTTFENRSLRDALGCFPDLQSWLASLSPDVKEALFEDYPWLKGYVIDLPELIDNYHTSVLITANEEGSVGIIRKWKGNIINGKFTGELLLTDLENKTILHNQYEGGIRISENDKFNDWVENGVGCKPNAGSGAYFGHCTRAQFNAAYQRAKSECEGDFVCDVACSFNPCWVMYLTSAMIDCR